MPDGWELVRIGRPMCGEFRVSSIGKPVAVTDNEIVAKDCPIIRKIDKPKQYRPFANAAEFEPFRDRWVTRKDKSDKEAQPGAFLVAAYDDVGYWCSGGVHERFDTAFSHGRCFDDDGTPFGVRIDGE